jgi:2-keto-4-pentenoate hydratase/2-oxohepta-3-ene-1,7-dioic acid hydratase in catechol pathway
VVAQRAPGHAAYDVTDLASGDIKNLLPLDLADLDLDPYPTIDLDTVTWLPPVPHPERIICIGLNYLSHAAEVMKDAPPWPTVFTRFPSTFVGHRQPLVRPAASDTLDWEGEIVVVIGRGGRHIEQADALDHVAGYSLMGENSIREFQLHTTQAAAGKNWDASGSWGPWIVSRDAMDGVPELVTQLNGLEKQRGNLDELAFDVPTLIAYVSTWTALQPGDVIATGTPAGIGHRESPPRYLQPGDELTITMPGQLTLTNPVVAETDRPPAPLSETAQEVLR